MTAPSICAALLCCSAHDQAQALSHASAAGRWQRTSPHFPPYFCRTMAEDIQAVKDQTKTMQKDVDSMEIMQNLQSLALSIMGVDIKDVKAMQAKHDELLCALAKKSVRAERLLTGEDEELRNYVEWGKGDLRACRAAADATLSSLPHVLMCQGALDRCPWGSLLCGLLGWGSAWRALRLCLLPLADPPGCGISLALIHPPHVVLAAARSRRPDWLLQCARPARQQGAAVSAAA